MRRNVHNQHMANINPRNELAKRVETLGSMRAVAREIGCSVTYVSEALKGTRDVGPAILEYLEIERKIVTRRIYRRKKPQ